LAKTEAGGGGGGDRGGAGVFGAAHDIKEGEEMSMFHQR